MVTYASMPINMVLSGSREIPITLAEIDPFEPPQMVVKQFEGILAGLISGTFEVELRARPSNTLLGTLTWTSNGRERVSLIDYNMIDNEEDGILLTVTSSGVGVTSCQLNVISKIHY